MITRKKRLFYTIFVGSFIILGVLIFYYVVPPSSMKALFAILGGFLFGGLTSGGILVTRYIKRKYSLALTIISCVLFPITLGIIYIFGAITLLPYYICNLIALLRIQNEDDIQAVEIITKKVNRCTLILTIVIMILAFIGSNLYAIVRENNISHDINVKTGYSEGAPEYYIIRNFCYKPDAYEKFDLHDYDYAINNRILFFLVQVEDFYISNTIYPDKNGMYRQNPNAIRRLINTVGKSMREDLDSFFSKIQITQYENIYAYTLVIDMTNKSYDFASRQFDTTYGDPDNMQLLDQQGEPISRLETEDGKYVVYFDAIGSDEVDYMISIVNHDETIPLLTYTDISSFNIGPKK